MLENDITDVLDETFSTTDDCFNEIVTVLLIPGDKNIPVTENKRNMCIVSKEMFSVFNEDELEWLIDDISDVDV
ncbi:hypothetical protein NEOLEDRAFT_1182414 [Neolentinus lepideus HHB14362 ss-1]|uniref:Uncharacterized protein n=1 Tax=Neolentinus lepideus HHB14362 ss-1 TaxID=1314782 RepID=A0A165P5P6_9AGAM|nr:hypothetical protein NEOLEDRAFT_1182414 [Neolentinus lepideus HHB14362 ss-1]